MQPNIEVNFLTNKITAAPAMSAYRPEQNSAPLCRWIFGRLLARIEGSDGHPDDTKSKFDNEDQITSLFPSLPGDMKLQLLAETVHAIVAIGGHDNPPARHIVGLEGVASVKEKLKTVSEELEDFVEVSCAVDIDEHEGFDGVAPLGRSSSE